MFRKRRLYSYSLLMLLLIPFITQAGLTFIESGFITSIIIRVGGVAELIPLLALLLVGLFLKERQLCQEYRYIYVIVVAGLLYSLISLAIGIVFVNSPAYLLGDFFRYALPLVGAFCILTAVKTPSSGQLYIESLVCALIFVTCIKLLAKGYMLSTGVFYGGGWNQFYLEPFLIVVLIFGIKNNGIKYGNLNISKIFCLLLLLISLFFVVLSLKRSAWVITFFVVFLNLIYFKKTLKAIILILPILLIIIWYMKDGPVAQAIISRFEYTFSGSLQLGVDRSTYERIAEVRSAFLLLGSDASFLEYLFGRGSGAEFVAHPSFPLAKSQTGSMSGYFHHIHSMYAITIFRHGLIGLVFYLLAPVVVLIGFSKAHQFTNRSPLDFSAVIVFASICQLMSLLIAGISSNSIYGYGGYGIYIAASTSSFLLIRSKTYAGTKNSYFRQ